MSCACRCHAYGAGTMVTCDVDTGSSGVPGKASCTPCDGGPVGAVGAAGPVDQAAADPAAPPAPPVVPPERACVLGHGEVPAERRFGLLCARHFHELDGRLTEIETLFALRDELLLPGAASGPAVSGGGFGSPAPGRIELMEITDARRDDAVDPNVPRVLAFWAWEVAARRRLAVKVTGDVTASVRVLRLHRKWIAAQVWVVAYAAAMRDVHRALARASGASMWAEPVGRCPNCRTKIFNDLTGADVVACRRCKASWSGVAWLRLRLIFEQEAGKR